MQPTTQYTTEYLNEAMYAAAHNYSVPAYDAFDRPYEVNVVPKDSYPCDIENILS